MLALVAVPGAPGGIELRDVPDPEPASNQALVEVRAASLNRGECVTLRQQTEDGWRPGWDLGGLVLRQAADGTGPAAGARVAGWMNGGSWAERVASRTDHLAELPDDLGFDVAATLPVAGLTAFGTLARRGALLGTRVAITGAAGGVGRFAVQLAHRGGAHVTGIVGRPQRAEGLAELGADDVVMGLEAQGEPFDLILESVGGASLAAAIERLAAEGVVVSIGNSSNETTSFDSRILYRKGSPRIEGYFVTWELLHGRIGSEELSYLASLAATGALESRIDLRVSWRDAASAVNALLDRRVAGKAVLTID
ncbi:MAG TPA: zinc-binding dehydrogenase [Actinomycetota bacterium]|nr:zinc-binding dehydrogenase [Actinomycetota bacterium]